MCKHPHWKKSNPHLFVELPSFMSLLSDSEIHAQEEWHFFLSLFIYFSNLHLFVYKDKAREDLGKHFVVNNLLATFHYFLSSGIMIFLNGCPLSVQFCEYLLYGVQQSWRKNCFLWVPGSHSSGLYLLEWHAHLLQVALWKEDHIFKCLSAAFNGCKEMTGKFTPLQRAQGCLAAIV